MADSGTFLILKEDHTLGNLIRMSVLRDRRVIFCGYRIPHPLENKLVVKIRTHPHIDPVIALGDGLTQLNTELSQLASAFKQQAAAHSSSNTHGGMDML